jgi:hypothetical protein
MVHPPLTAIVALTVFFARCVFGSRFHDGRFVCTLRLMSKPHRELLRATAYRYTVLFERAPEGGYVATIPVLGIATQGETLREARAMARDAI